MKNNKDFHSFLRDASGANPRPAHRQIETMVDRVVLTRTVETFIAKDPEAAAVKSTARRRQLLRALAGCCNFAREIRADSTLHFGLFSAWEREFFFLIHEKGADGDGARTSAGNRKGLTRILAIGFPEDWRMPAGPD